MIKSISAIMMVSFVASSCHSSSNLESGISLKAVHGEPSWQVITDSSDARLNHPAFQITGRFDSAECTGFLIDSKTVMTARHCFLPQEDSGDSESSILLSRGYFRLTMVNGVEKFKAKPVRVFHPGPDIETGVVTLGTDWAFVELDNDLPMPENTKVEVMTTIPSLPQTVSLIGYSITPPAEQAGVSSSDQVGQKLTGISPVWDKNCTLYQRDKSNQLLLHDCQSMLGSSGAPIFRYETSIVGGVKTGIIKIFGMNVADPMKGFYYPTIELPGRNKDGDLISEGNANVAVSSVSFAPESRRDLTMKAIEPPSFEVFLATPGVDTAESFDSSGSVVDKMRVEWEKSLGLRLALNVFFRDQDADAFYGYRVNEVLADSLAQRLGVRPGDIILQIDKHWIRDISPFLAEIFPQKNATQNSRELIIARPQPDYLNGFEWTVEDFQQAERVKLLSFSFFL